MLDIADKVHSVVPVSPPDYRPNTCTYIEISDSPCYCQLADLVDLVDPVGLFVRTSSVTNSCAG